ncbi:MAG: hypothetical protein OSB57_01775 [Planctomycetota bacterium]|nr:hypothetical protein [Planctomycetota bacterium]
MPEYTFEDVETGERVELFFTGDDPARPKFGEERVIAGRKLRRLVEGGVTVAVEPDLHFTAQQFEDWVPGAPRYDSVGRAQFASRKEVKDFVDRSDGKHAYGKYKGKHGA